VNRVTNGKDIGMLWDRQIRLHENTPGAIGRSAKPFGSRRSSDTRSPKDRA
jgi:hypothetical protein